MDCNEQPLLVIKLSEMVNKLRQVRGLFHEQLFVCSRRNFAKNSLKMLQLAQKREVREQFCEPYTAYTYKEEVKIA